MVVSNQDISKLLGIVLYCYKEKDHKTSKQQKVFQVFPLSQKSGHPPVGVNMQNEHCVGPKTVKYRKFALNNWSDV